MAARAQGHGEQVGAGRDPHPGLGQGRHHLVQGFLDLSTCDRSMAMDQSWWVLGGFPELTAAFDHVLNAISGQRVIPGVRVGAPGPARRLLYVTRRCVCGVAARYTVPPTSVHEPVHGPYQKVLETAGGGWGSNPRRADYESLQSVEVVEASRAGLHISRSGLLRRRGWSRPIMVFLSPSASKVRPLHSRAADHRKLSSDRRITAAASVPVLAASAATPGTSHSAHIIRLGELLLPHDRLHDDQVCRTAGTR